MKKKSILSNFRLFFIISISISFLIISIVFSTIYNHTLTQNNKTNITNTLTTIKSNINKSITELNSIANVPYYDSSIFKIMIEMNHSNNKFDNQSLSNDSTGKFYRRTFINYIYNASILIDNISFYPAQNKKNTVYTVNRNEAKTIVKTDKHYRLRPWYTYLTKDSLTPVFLPVYSKDNTLQSFIYAKAIRDTDTKKVIGYITIEASADAFTSLLDTIKVRSGSALLMTYNNTDIIYMNSHGQTLDQIVNYSNLQNKYKQPAQIIKQNLSTKRLHLIYLISGEQLLKDKLFIYLIVFIFVLCSIAVSFFLYQKKAKKVASKIQQIQQSLLNVEQGNLYPIQIKAQEYELQQIVNSINYMIEQTNDFITREYKATLIHQEAEFRALQAQISPHFLYNTLNGFIGLNRMGDRSLLEKSIFNLTHLFQYTHQPSTFTTLKTELDFVEKYLELQSLKYEDRMTYSINIDETCYGVTLPKLILQPIVENSIIHGIEPTAELIKIEISCFPTVTSLGNFVTIILKDTGCGFFLEELNYKECIGLHNIRKRLAFTNKDNFFEIYSKPGLGTTCILLLKEEYDTNENTNR